MLTSIIVMLIYVALLVAAVWLVLWVLGQVGVTLPEPIVRIIWVIVVLLVLLWFVQAFLGGGIGLPSLR